MKTLLAVLLLAGVARAELVEGPITTDPTTSMGCYVSCPARDFVGVTCHGAIRWRPTDAAADFCAGFCRYDDDPDFGEPAGIDGWLRNRTSCCVARGSDGLLYAPACHCDQDKHFGGWRTGTASDCDCFYPRMPPDVGFVGCVG